MAPSKYADIIVEIKGQIGIIKVINFKIDSPPSSQQY
jgi:hypothetical protein